MKKVKHRRRRKFLLEDTALAIYLSLNIEIIDDARGKQLATLPLLPLTWLWLLIWQLYLTLSGGWQRRPKWPPRRVRQTGTRRWHSAVVRATGTGSVEWDLNS